MDIKSLCTAKNDFAVATRRDFHMHAEPAWFEFRTSAKIAEILEKNGIKTLMGKQIVNPEFAMGYPSMEEIDKNIARALAQGADKKYIDRMEGYTGVAAIIETGKPGKTLAMRFDIDCNDVMENKAQEHFAAKNGFASINDNCMHACGHDGHATMGLVTALVLNSIKDSLTGTIKIIFQPAEEGVRGALSIAKSGILDDVDFFLAGHIGKSDDGALGVDTHTGGFLATTKLDVTFHGEATHSGASPEKGKNALLAAAFATLAMHSMVQDGRGVGRVNVGKLIAGTGRNVVPDIAFLAAETRGATTDINETIYANVMNAIEGAARMYGVSYEVKKMGGAQSATADSDLREIVNQVVRECGIEPNTEFENLGGSEDVSYMMRRVQECGGKAMHMFLNTAGTGSAHNELYNFDENVIVFGAEIYCKWVERINK